FDKTPSSSYLGDLLGQLLVRLGQIEQAKEVYLQARRVLTELREPNVWTYATLLSAAIVCDDNAGIQQSLKELHDLRPSRGDVDSIERGANNLVNALGRDKAVLENLRGMEKQS